MGGGISAQTKRRLMEDPDLDKDLYEKGLMREGPPGGAAAAKLDLPSKSKGFHQRRMTQAEYDKELAELKKKGEARYQEYQTRRRK